MITTLYGVEPLTVSAHLSGQAERCRAAAGMIQDLDEESYERLTHLAAQYDKWANWVISVCDYAMQNGLRGT